MYLHLRPIPTSFLHDAPKVATVALKAINTRLARGHWPVRPDGPFLAARHSSLRLTPMMLKAYLKWLLRATNLLT